MKTSRALIALAVMFGLPILSANAVIAIPFSDTFDSEGTPNQSAKNFGSFTNWTVDAGSVDLIDDGTNPWSLTCASGSGKCIDLDGSSSMQGTISTNDTFSPGTYSLQFDLSGSQRGGSFSDSVTVTFGDFSQQYTRDFDDPWETIIIPGINVTAGNDVLTFASTSSGSDNVGLLLDNVLVVPLPAAFWLFSSGLIGMIGLSRRRRVQQV